MDAGHRERRPRKVVIDVPYTIIQGLELMRARRKVRFRDAFGRFRAGVTPEDFERTRHEHFDEGKRLRDIVKANTQYSKETIRRILGRDRGYVGVKGIGRVDTTDTSLRDPGQPPTESP